MRRGVLMLLALLTLVATGCGRDRIDPPDTIPPAPPVGTAQEAFPEEGLFLERPGNWPFRPGRPPLVASTSNGTATVALWRYLRSEPLPREPDAVEDAQAALEEAAKARDPTFELQRSTRTEVDGAPAIELRGTETIAGRKRRVRSIHVFAKEAEVVLDAYAAPEDFERVDREVFDPIVESLKIDPPEEAP
ncbi:MAG TPA: hypothetical protein VGR12_00910 [Solirubrobacteraceae bacterium]|nr:hypothetical protein [Solirubrobacteraceae bacterium]